MNDERVISEGVYLIAGPNISRGEDATAFIVDCGTEMVMIDSGAGNSCELMVGNIKDLGLDPERISTLILTHCHIDHIGGAPYFKKRFNCRLVAHELDAEAIEQADTDMTAADAYGASFPPTPVDVQLHGELETVVVGEQAIQCLHIPGHTPGSIAPYLDRGEKRIVFGQDIHGPFLKRFRSDLGQWKRSMEKLLALKADILCEGHFGIFSSPDRAEAYILRYLKEYS